MCSLVSFKLPNRLSCISLVIRKSILAMLQDMSNRARREGTLALEEFIDKVDDDYFSRGVQLVVDGHEPNAIEDLLYNEIEKIKERHEQGLACGKTLPCYLRHSE